MRRYKYLIFLVLLAVVFTGCSVSVSSPGSVEGYVYIPTGYLAPQSVSDVEPLFVLPANVPSGYVPLTGANVRIVGRAEHDVTDSSGHFLIRGLPPERYILTVDHPDIRRVEKTIYISSGTKTVLDGGNAGVAYYIVIGVEKYHNWGPHDQKTEDALAVYEELYESNRLAGRGRLLIQPDIGEKWAKPDRAEIKDAIREAALLSKSEHDYLVIYFTGDSGENVIRPSGDFNGNSRITDGELESWVREFPGQVTLIIDANDSATWADGTTLGSQAFQKTYYTVLGATGTGQNAGAHKDENHSWFTYHLLSGIRTRDADENKDGDITAKELYEYVDSAMAEDESYKIQKPFLWPGQSGDAVVYRYERY